MVCVIRCHSHGSVGEDDVRLRVIVCVCFTLVQCDIGSLSFGWQPGPFRIRAPYGKLTKILMGQTRMYQNTKSGLFHFVCMMVLALSCTAAQASEWWSLGAFKIPANAERESDRINAELGVDTIIARSGDLYRVVLKKDGDPVQQKTDLQAQGLNPWTLAASEVGDDQPDEMEERKPQAPEIAAEPVQTPYSMEDEPESETVYEMSPPKPGEKLLDYCVNRANKQERAVYCNNDMFNRVASAQARAKDQSEADSLLYCGLLADGAERRAQCGRD
jgi:hypothetical protein